MSNLCVAMVGFDITPQFHPTCGAWGTSPSLTEVDMPLLGRCLALDQGGQRLIWFGFDLFGEMPATTDQLRCEVAEALGVTADQVIWSTSETHCSGVFPGSTVTAVMLDVSQQDHRFMAEQRKRFINACIDAGREAIDGLRPAKLRAGRGHCDSMSYNSRLPMPGGAVKFSRQYDEGLRSGKFFDPTITLVRFEDHQGRAIGAIFNFGCRLATIINERWVSPDWVGAARTHVEDALDGAPAIYLQGTGGDVTCRHIFGTPAQARQNGEKVGRAAARAMATLIPARAEPVDCVFEQIEIPCQPMPTRHWFEQQIEARQRFIDQLTDDPGATWFCGINLPEQMSAQEKISVAEMHIEYLREGLRMLDAGESPPSQLPVTVGAVRIGDVGAVLLPGIQFATTGLRIRQRSPFVHTLVCSDTGGIFGYIGPDDEIDRRGYETETSWFKLTVGGFRRPPAHGSVDRVVNTCSELLQRLHGTI